MDFGLKKLRFPIKHTRNNYFLTHTNFGKVSNCSIFWNVQKRYHGLRLDETQQAFLPKQRIGQMLGCDRKRKSHVELRCRN